MKIKIFLYTIIILSIIPQIFAKEYTVGVENIDYYPFYSVNSKGEYVGFARDVLDFFAKNEHIKFVYEVRTVKKLDQEYVAERKFDFKFPDNKLWKSGYRYDTTLYYSSPVCDFIDGVIVQSENKDKDINFFKSQGIGIVRGYSILGFEDKGIFLKESPNIETLIERLKYNVIDGAYFNVTVALNKVNHNDGSIEEFAFDEKVPYYKGSFYLSTFDNRDLIEDFNKFLVDKRDEINDIKLKYGIQN